MLMLEASVVLTTVLSLIVISLALALGAKPGEDLEKATPFECGFIPQAQHRIPFSLHFFLVTLVFIIFDVELVLLFPYLLQPLGSALLLSFFLLVVVLLSVGLFFEWSQKMFEWNYFK